MKSKNILFATVPQDGHFNPLTGLAVHLKALGHDVRWYTGSTYAPKLHKLGIQFYPYRQALEVPHDKMEEIFPERRRHKSQISKLKFDLKHYFVLRTAEQFADIKQIYQEFPFDVLVYDVGFTGALLVQAKLQVPIVGVGVLPLPDTSVDLAPPGLGLTPSYSYWGRAKQALLRLAVERFIFKEATAAYNQILESYGVKPVKGVFLDALVKRADLYLQSGVPGFDYPRGDRSPNVQFVGALLPYPTRRQQTPIFEEKLKQYAKRILVTQGTVEKDPEKILVPTLEAFKNSDYLVIATTGGSKTQELRDRYPQANIIIEDYIDFTYIMPHCQVYVTNGGYGGVMLGIEHQLPLVVAGEHEGKNEINARVGYFQIGINLRTERPTPAQVRASVESVLAKPIYKKNLAKLSAEFKQYQPNELSTTYLTQLLEASFTDPEVSTAVAKQPEGVR